MEELIVASENYTAALEDWAKKIEKKIDSMTREREELLAEVERLKK